MKPQFVLVFLPLFMFAAIVDVFSQIPQPPRPDEEQRRESEERIKAERELRMQNMREFDAKMKAINRPRKSDVPANPAIDKETAGRIERARRVDPTDVSRYSEFLRSEKSGLFKLFPDHDCVTATVIRTDGDCKDFIMASSSFSFRTRNYVHPYYHDMGFNHGQIFSRAFFLQGIFVSLGDVPIENVTLSHDGTRSILAFPAAADPAEARTMAVRLKAGMDLGGFKYSSAVKPAENTTFILRSIAYDVANSLPAISEKTSRSELRFHTLRIDKRGDVTVVFRIVRKGEDGSLTILWKELDRKDAPKIKFPKGEKFVDFEPEVGQTW